MHATDASRDQLLADDEGLALAAEVVRTGEEVLHQDVTACEIAEGPWHADAGAVAVMGLPLQVAHRTVGALVVAHTIAQPRGFTSLCQQVGAAVAQQAALAVEHARLFEVERDNVQRLEELDRMKADWMAGVTHDLKAPLMVSPGSSNTCVA
ncbi:MAG: GAF domain-containing protein [Xanthomonadales bacterium]|nr:GAF domain-containing protein [Xanthomonadales bacterium]